VLIAVQKMRSSLENPFGAGNVGTVSCTRRERSGWSSLKHGSLVGGNIQPGRSSRGMMCLRLIQAGSTEVTSVLRQRNYHILPLFYFSSSIQCQIRRDRPENGAYQATLIPTLKNSILSTIPLPASLGGRKTLTHRPHAVTRTESRNANSVCASSNA